MNRWIQLARALGGLAAIVTLLGMVVADFLYGHLTLQPETVALLVTISATLLAVDRLVERELPVTITVGSSDSEQDE